MKAMIFSALPAFATAVILLGACAKKVDYVQAAPVMEVSVSDTPGPAILPESGR